MNKLSVDQGTAFGTWSDDTSRFMYEASLPPILEALQLSGHVGDFGGANGLLTKHLVSDYPCTVTTIDSDPTKKPDIVDDILFHDKPYDVAWCRYVLHYLTDQEVIRFIDKVNAPRIIVVQFCNEDLRVKYRNSFNEVKHFRTLSQTAALLGGDAVLVGTGEYLVTSEFYKNRLGLDGAEEHEETLAVFEIRR